MQVNKIDSSKPIIRPKGQGSAGLSNLSKSGCKSNTLASTRLKNWIEDREHETPAILRQAIISVLLSRDDKTGQLLIEKTLRECLATKPEAVLQMAAKILPRDEGPAQQTFAPIVVNVHANGSPDGLASRLANVPTIDSGVGPANS